MQMKIVWQLWLQTTLDSIQASSLKLLPEVPGEVKDYLTEMLPGESSANT